MSTRSMEARLVKLEARRQRPNEMLLVWRRPNADVRQALARAEYEPGDKVICAKWHDDSPVPAPRWYQERLTRDLDPAGQANLDRCLAKIRDRIDNGKPRDPAFAPFPLVQSNRIVELTDNQLLHALLGVAT